MTWLAAAVALASAVAAGWSTALMHYGASGAGPGVSAGELARHVLSDWRWRLGVAASLVGLALHATALHLGSLTIVQPLAVTALFFSMVFRDLLDHRAPPRRTVVWGAITAVGLGLFLTAARPTGGEDLPDGQAAALLIGLGAAGVVLAVRASQRILSAHGSVARDSRRHRLRPHGGGDQVHHQRLERWRALHVVAALRDGPGRPDWFPAEPTHLQPDQAARDVADAEPGEPVGGADLRHRGFR